MAPKWLPGGLWAALGCRLCFQRLPGALLEGPGDPKKFVVGGLGASWGEKLIDFRPRGGPRERPGALKKCCWRSGMSLGAKS